MVTMLRRLSLQTPTAKQIADLVDARESKISDGQDFVRPSAYWDDFINKFSYVFELSDESLKQIRYHTFHLTSDLYLRYYLGSKEDEQNFLNKYITLSKVAGNHSLAEPLSGIGFPHEEGLVSWDVLRYLSVICDLLTANVLSEQPSSRIVEIGGGYGGLCRMISMLNPCLHYSIIDLEETLFFSKCYLDKTLPNYDIKLVTNVKELEFNEKRINLIPQHILEEIEDKFDLAINHQSMQEMEVPQINRYLKFIARSCAKFYSRNMKRHDVWIALKKSLSVDIHSQILEWFPEILWRDGSAHADNLIDDHLLRFIVNCKHNKADDRNPIINVISSPLTSRKTQIKEQSVHQGDMLDVYELFVASSFSVSLSTETYPDVITLIFVTWATVIKRLELEIIIRDAENNVIQRSTVTCLDVHDWEEITFDLRGTTQKESPFTIGFSVCKLSGEGRLGIPLFQPTANSSSICELSIGRELNDQLVHAGRLLELLD